MAKFLLSVNYKLEFHHVKFQNHGPLGFYRLFH